MYDNPYQGLKFYIYFYFLEHSSFSNISFIYPSPNSSQGELTPIWVEACFVFSSFDQISWKKVITCKRNFGGAFLDTHPSTSSLLNVKHGFVPHVNPFSYAFCPYYTNATTTLYF